MCRFADVDAGYVAVDFNSVVSYVSFTIGVDIFVSIDWCCLCIGFLVTAICLYFVGFVFLCLVGCD